MADALRVTVQPISNSTTFYPDTPSGINVLGQCSYEQQIQGWMAELPYLQKVELADTFGIEIHTQDDSGPMHLSGTPELYVCDIQKNVIGTPSFKGKFYKVGNDYSASGGGLVPLVSSMWSFSFNDLSLPEGYYFLKLINKSGVGAADVVYYSEPLDVRSSHANTLLFQFLYNSNIRAKNIMIEGFYDDYPTNTLPYSPAFTLRCEGYIQRGYTPKAINIGYTQQNYNQVQIKTQQKRVWQLCIGDLSIGVPDWMLEKVGEALLSDVVYINNYNYIIFNQGGQNTLSDLFKVKSVDASPLLTASIAITQVSDNQNALVSPPPVFDDGIFNDVFDDTFA